MRRCEVRAAAAEVSSLVGRGLFGISRSNLDLVLRSPRRDAQLALDLRAPRSRGGRRAGAGRKRQAGSGLPHASRAHFRRPLPAHVTLRLRADLPSLRTVPIVREIERTFARGCARPGFRLVHYSLQGNHAHLIVEAQDRGTLGRGMMAIGARLARAVNRIAGRSGRVLADRYHMRLLPTPREVHRALPYVLLNARRHAASARATSRVLLDPASSAAWFEGWKRRVPDAQQQRPSAMSLRPPVARARTWLLSVGWRRHGLLDPTDVPG
jgi:REP-associated tyrosine transposase